MKRLIGLIVVGLLLGVGSPVAADGVDIGELAPEFSLPDADGQMRNLSDVKGQFVVLEWLNHDCPFVRKHYGSGNMQGLQNTYTAKEVAWFSIISSAPGKQGHCSGEEAKELTISKEAAPTAVLLDPEGEVGRRYGAKTTPHMFVIDPEGTIVYQGAIDDRPSTDVSDIPGATNYVQLALDQSMSGAPVAVPITDSYGCSVKYGNFVKKEVKKESETY